MLRQQYEPERVSASRPNKNSSSRLTKAYVPSHFVHVPSRQKASQPHLSSLVASEKQARLREVKALEEDKKNLSRGLEQTQSREQVLEVENRSLREDLEKQTRALQVTRKMFGALAEEKVRV